MTTFMQNILLLNVVTVTGSSGIGTPQPSPFTLYTCPAGRFAEITLNSQCFRDESSGSQNDYYLLINGVNVQNSNPIESSVSAETARVLDVSFTVTSGQTIAVTGNTPGLKAWHLSAKEFANP